MANEWGEDDFDEMPRPWQPSDIKGAPKQAKKRPLTLSEKIEKRVRKIQTKLLFSIPKMILKGGERTQVIYLFVLFVILLFALIGLFYTVEVIIVFFLKTFS